MPHPVWRHTACHIEALRPLLKPLGMLKPLLKPLIAADWHPICLLTCLCHSLQSLLWVGRPPPQNWSTYWTYTARLLHRPPCLGTQIRCSLLTVYSCFRVLQISHEQPFPSTSDSDHMLPYPVNISGVLQTLRDILHMLWVRHMHSSLKHHPTHSPQLPSSNPRLATLSSSMMLTVTIAVSLSCLLTTASSSPGLGPL